jgi:hypothetical protein
MKQIVIVVMAILAFAAMPLFLVGAIGGQIRAKSSSISATKANAMAVKSYFFKSISAKVKVSGTDETSMITTVYGALRTGATEVRLGSQTSYGYTIYSDCKDNSKECKTYNACDASGNAAMALFALSFIFSFFIFIMQVWRLRADGSALCSGILILTALAIIFTMAALADFNVDCIRPAFDLLISASGGQNSYTENWGPGFITPLCSLLFMFLVMISNAIFFYKPEPMAAKAPSKV